MPTTAVLGQRAARLESHTKVAQRKILIDRETREGLAGQIPVEALGPVAFKGMTTPVEVFHVTETTM